ncbi:hypothetical protein SAMN05428966_11690 [Massilia sp. PDC64]|nr:hypothetical protein [Massilia sp. PDC64]SDF50690.1 hypothetical protein SAMN05428966_11690 [Massilia sp. PDC64]
MLGYAARIGYIHTSPHPAILKNLETELRNFSRPLVLAALASGLNAYAADVSKELSWSSVQLEGAHLQLVSPKEKDRSQDLYFSKDGNLVITSCIKGTCTGPVIVWKIENNRLKTGYAPSEGDALVNVQGNRLTLREPSGKIVVYEIRGRR